jgi:hypothetical protein
VVFLDHEPLRGEGSSLLGRTGPDSCSELKKPTEVISIPPGLGYLSVDKPENENRGKGLLSSTAGYPKETLLYARVRRAHDHLVALGDHVLNQCTTQRAQVGER